MDKLKLAHDWAMKSFLNHGFKDEAERAAHAWQYADAMQAEAKEREPSGLPEALCEVDWSQAPRGAAAYMKLSAWDIGVWIDDLGFQINDAPTFGFTGSHIVERPHGF